MITAPVLHPLRDALAGDRHRPLYHFLAPSNWMNDPNGAIFWKGKYHLFYQYNPNSPSWGTIHWGHAASSDLVHWEDFPIALSPSKEGPDKHGCWSGCVVDDQGVPTALYTAPGPQTVCLATGDGDLTRWTKREVPVISLPPPGLDLTGFPSITGDASAGFRDPFVWREGERWLLLIGSGIRGKGGTALLYESEDLRHWHYRQPFLTAMVGTDCQMWECPILLRVGDRCAMFICPHPEAKYVSWFAGRIGLSPLGLSPGARSGALIPRHFPPAGVGSPQCAHDRGSPRCKARELATDPGRQKSGYARSR